MAHSLYWTTAMMHYSQVEVMLRDYVVAGGTGPVVDSVRQSQRRIVEVLISVPLQSLLPELARLIVLDDLLLPAPILDVVETLGERAAPLAPSYAFALQNSSNDRDEDDPFLCNTELVAIRALASVGLAAVGVIELLLRHERPRPRVLAIRALASLARRHPESAARIRELLPTLPDWPRVLAVRALRDLEPLPHWAVPELEAHLSDRYTLVGFEADFALSHLQPGRPPRFLRSMEQLLAVVGDTAVPSLERLRAADVIAARPADVLPYLADFLGLLDSAEPVGPALSYSVLHTIIDSQPVVVPMLVHALDSTAYTVAIRIAIADALMLRGPDVAVFMLEPLLRLIPLVSVPKRIWYAIGLKKGYLGPEGQAAARRSGLDRLAPD